MAYYGYSGSILRVDLTEGSIQEEPLDPELIEKFIGGWGINNKLFYDIQRPKEDPFSPDSPIIIGVGALVGTPTPGASKVIATYKSPIFAGGGRHFVDNAVSGSGRFGTMLKGAGCAHIVITGRADTPVYLKLSDDGTEICDASNLWGKRDIYGTIDYMNEKYGDCGVISIGQAGENLVRYAMAVVDYFGSLGKFGFGAAMGSKNLKAVVTRGSGAIRLAKPEKYMELVRGMRKSIIDRHPQVLESFRELGIMSGWALQGPLANEGYWKFRRLTKLYGPGKWRGLKKRKYNSACSSCILACRVDYEVKEGEFKGLTSFTASYFIPTRIGQRLEITDINQSVKLLDICNRAGMCALTTSGMVNWVTRLYEDGALTKEKTGGLELSRNFETYIGLFEDIVHRRGLGDLLADGWYPVSEKIGSDPDEFVQGTGICKGADCIQDIRFTTLDPQRFAYFTNPRPHHGGVQSAVTLPKMPLDILKEDVRNMGVSEDAFDRIFTPAEYYGDFNVGIYGKHSEDVMAVHNGVGTCIVYAIPPFLALNVNVIAPIYSAATGIEVTPEELKKRGERAFNLSKMINVREGFSRKDDRCSNIWLTPRQTPDGPRPIMDYYRKREISKEDIDRLLDDYYKERGWDVEEGIPSQRKLAELGLEFI